MSRSFCSPPPLLRAGDASLPIAKRLEDLVGRLSLDEKIGLGLGLSAAPELRAWEALAAADHAREAQKAALDAARRLSQSARAVPDFIPDSKGAYIRRVRIQ